MIVDQGNWSVILYTYGSHLTPSSGANEGLLYLLPLHMYSIVLLFILVCLLIGFK